MDGWIHHVINIFVPGNSLIVTKVKRTADYGIFSFYKYKPYIGERTRAIRAKKMERQIGW